jgi:hypothetical protein
MPQSSLPQIVVREALPCRRGEAPACAPRGVYTLERTDTDEFRLRGEGGPRYTLSCDAFARLIHEGRLAFAV